MKQEFALWTVTQIFSIFDLDFNVIAVHKSACVGAQSLGGRVLDSRPRGRGFEPQRRHCVLILEQDTLILA